MADDTAAQLRDVQDEIDRIRGEGQGLTNQVGAHNDGAGDEADTAAALTNLEETDAILSVLEAKRERLEAKLGGGE